jgi:hypothetical protein
MSPSRVLVICLTLVGVVLGSVQQPPQKLPLEDCRDDDHGDICWKSTAEPKFSGSEWWWEYKRSVLNHHEMLKCRVHWIPAKFKSLIKPAEAVLAGKVLTDLPPVQIDGKILYNGGSAAGEGSAAAPVWGPKKEVSEDKRTVSSTATVMFGFGQEIYKVTLTATSQMQRVTGSDTPQYKVFYDLRSNDFLKLPEAVRVRWDSVESPEWEELIGKDNVQVGKYLQFKGGTFQLNLTTRRRPVFRDESIRFLDQKNNLLAEAWLPALAPDAQ